MSAIGRRFLPKLVWHNTDDWIFEKKHASTLYAFEMPSRSFDELKLNAVFQKFGLEPSGYLKHGRESRFLDLQTIRILVNLFSEPERALDHRGHHFCPRDSFGHIEPLKSRSSTFRILENIRCQGFIKPIKSKHLANTSVKNDGRLQIWIPTGLGLLATVYLKTLPWLALESKSSLRVETTGNQNSFIQSLSALNRGQGRFISQFLRHIPPELRRQIEDEFARIYENIPGGLELLERAMTPAYLLANNYKALLEASDELISASWLMHKSYEQNLKEKRLPEMNVLSSIDYIDMKSGLIDARIAYVEEIFSIFYPGQSLEDWVEG